LSLQFGLGQNLSHLCFLLPHEMPHDSPGKLSWVPQLTVLCSTVFTHSPGSQQHHYVNLLFPSEALSISNLSPGMLLSSHFECGSVPKGELGFLMYLRNLSEP